MSNTKVFKVLFVLIVIAISVSSFCIAPVAAATRGGASTYAYQSILSKAFIGNYRTAPYYMDGKYLGFEITCVASDNQDHTVYVDVYRDCYGSTYTVPVHSDGAQRTYSGLEIGNGSAVDFTLRCNSSAIISFNLIFYSWS